MGKVHKLGSSVDSPWVKFPDNFCLEELINDTCGAPAGVSAIVYDTNPLVKLFIALLQCKFAFAPAKKRGTWWVLASPAERYGMSIAKTRPRISPSSQNCFAMQPHC